MNRSFYNARVYEILKAMNINLGQKGYDYVKEALNLIRFENGLAGGYISLYEKIAANFHTTASRVERAIRHFVEAAFYQNSDMYKRIAGNVSYKPTNGHFLKALSEYIKYESVGSADNKEL